MNWPPLQFAEEKYNGKARSIHDQTEYSIIHRYKETVLPMPSWNSPNRFKKLRNLLSSLKIPNQGTLRFVDQIHTLEQKYQDLTTSQPDSNIVTEFVDAVVACCFTFVESLVCDDLNKVDTMPLKQLIFDVLRRHRDNFLKKNTHFTASLFPLPWHVIFQYIYDFLIRQKLNGSSQEDIDRVFFSPESKLLLPPNSQESEKLLDFARHTPNLVVAKRKRMRPTDEEKILEGPPTEQNGEKKQLEDEKSHTYLLPTR